MGKVKKIKFETSDFPIPIVDEIIKDLLGFILDYEEFMEVLARLLLEHTKYRDTFFGTINRQFEIIKRRNSLDKLLDGERLGELQKIFVECYKNIEVANFRKKLAGQSRELFLTQQGCLDIIRGKIFEEIAFEAVSKKYKGSSLKCGCIVIINGEEVKTRERKTVDIAGIKQGNYFFYECKVSPKSLDDNTYEYLHLLDGILLKNNYKYNIHCITLDTEDKLIDKSIYLRNKLGITRSNIKMVAREQLIAMIHDNVDNEVI